MSDLSQLPIKDPPPSAADATMPRRAPFTWPVPRVRGYPAASAVAAARLCQVEGLKGHQIRGELLGFDAKRLRLWLRTPAGGAPMALMFHQFRRITLGEVLRPLEDAGSSSHWRDADSHAALPYVWTDTEGRRLEGRTLAPVRKSYGVFLFEPVGDEGALRRSFVPQAAIGSIEFGERDWGELTPTEPMGLDPLVAITTADSGPFAPAPSGIEPAAERAPHPPASTPEAPGLAVFSAKPVTTLEQLDVALAAQSRMPIVRIGEALLAMGSITQKQFEEALAAQRQDHSAPLGELLVQRGVLSREDLRVALARKMGYPVVDVESFPLDTSALVRVPHAVARRLRVLPLALREGRLVVAMDDPSQRAALEELEFVTQASATPVLAQSIDLGLAISRAYERIGGTGTRDPRARGGQDPSAMIDASELLASLEQHSSDGDRGDEPTIEQSDNSLVRLINQMILEAQSQGVSDIHVECAPGREKVHIRFRKDGQLRLYLELPHTYRAAVIARLKIMCDLDISERRKPQDGKIAFGKFHTGSRLELRLATIPTYGGLEDAVLRLLTSAKLVPLDKLGLSPANLEGLKSAISRPYGMVLCVGPTGSGKTTTLHSALGMINKPDRKIWTAEDPIEITQAGLRQVQVNPKIDWTFARALRAFLRADPDVVMVGEIRDEETAQVAIEASLTGHLVLSTLHTNSAAETVTRLLDMGMDPFNFGDSLLAVLAQRLLRRLCPKCVTRREATDAEIDEWLDDYLHSFADPQVAPTRESLRADWVQRLGEDGRLLHHHAPGCPACDGSGLKGRAAIHELLLVSRELRRLIQTGGRAEQILAQAQREGMRTLRQDGIEKVIAGMTAIEEVRASSNV